MRHDEQSGSSRRASVGLPESATEEEVDAAFETIRIEQAEYYQRRRRQDVGLPESATEAEVSRAEDVQYEKDRRANVGLPESATEAEVIAAQDLQYERNRRENVGLPHSATEAEIEAAHERIRRANDEYFRPDTLSDETPDVVSEDSGVPGYTLGERLMIRIRKVFPSRKR